MSTPSLVWWPKRVVSLPGRGDRARLAGADTPQLAGRWAPDLVLHKGNGRPVTREARPLLLDLTVGGTLAEELSGTRDPRRAVTARVDDDGRSR